MLAALIVFVVVGGIVAAASMGALRLPEVSDRYTLDVSHLQDAAVRLNGQPLALNAHDELPTLDGDAIYAGVVTFAPATITFLAMPAARNAACR